MKAEFQLHDALAAQQWERTKGELRATVALQGSWSSGEDSEQWRRWKRLEHQVESFIGSVEENALQEPHG